MDVILLVDERERHVNMDSLLRQIPDKIQLQSKTLDIGDFHIIIRDPTRVQIIPDNHVIDNGQGPIVSNSVHESHILIERKTLNDLCSSVVDGRYKSQKERMQAFLNGNNKKGIYVLEGFNYADLIDWENYGSGISGKALKTIYLELQISHGFSVICTRDSKDTCATIADLVTRIHAKPEKYMNIDKNPNTCSITDIIKPKKADNLDSPLKFAVLQLCCLPRMSHAIAEGILAETGCTCIADFYKMVTHEPEKAFDIISNVKVNNKKVGKALVTRMFEFCGISSKEGP